MAKYTKRVDETDVLEEYVATRYAGVPTFRQIEERAAAAEHTAELERERRIFRPERSQQQSQQ